MRILLLAHSFNSLTQRLWVELEARGHEVSLELDINDATTIQAVALFAPELLIAPILSKRFGRPVKYVQSRSESFVLMYAVKATGTLRVSAAGEIEGLDIHEHGASAYPEYAFKGNDGTPRSLEEVKSKVKGTGLAPSASAGD